MGTASVSGVFVVTVVFFVQLERPRGLSYASMDASASAGAEKKAWMAMQGRPRDGT